MLSEFVQDRLANLPSRVRIGAESSRAEVQAGERQTTVKLYLDMCVYNRPFDDQSDLRIKLETIACQMIFEKIQAGKIELVWSFMLEFENELNPFTERKGEIVLLSRLARHLIEPNQAIQVKAENLERNGIKGKDSVHLGCALVGGCSHFVTCDDRIIKRSAALDLRMVVCNPVGFILKEGFQ